MKETQIIYDGMTANNLTPFRATHPGEIIREELEFRGISQRELARVIGVCPTIINELIKGKRQLGTELALLIGAALGLDAEPLIQLQVRYNIYRAKTDAVFQKKLIMLESARAFSIA